MPSTSNITRALVWARADQERLVRDAVDRSTMRIVAAGSQSPNDAVTLSKAFGVDRLPDVRLALQREDIDLIWLAEPDALPVDVLRPAREAGVRMITCSPQMGWSSDMGTDSSAIAEATFVPRMRRSPGFSAAMDVIAQFGAAQCINVSFRSGPAQGLLLARLYDAMDVINSLCEQTETINAALAGPSTGVPETLESLHGHLTINMRFKSNRCACAALSDCAGSWFRGVTVLGDGGCLRISDGGFDWIGPDGKTIDSHHAHTMLSPGELVGLQVARMLEDLDAQEPPPDHAALHALCEAARLSCVTGQDESPAKLLEMLSRP